MKAYNRKIRTQNLITYALVIGAFLVIQLMMAGGHVNSLLKGILVPLCTYVILAVSLNLTVGILGELSLGHAGFMCIGAFTGAFVGQCILYSSFNDTLLSFAANFAQEEKAIQTLAAQLRMIITIPLGAIVAAVFGIIIGIPVLRLKGDYLAIVTLAFGEIIKNVINVLYVGLDENGLHLSTKDASSMNMAEGGVVIINGPQGITSPAGLPRAATFTIGFVLVLITLFIVLNLIHSRSGRAIMAIRDNRIAAESVGINITKYKLMAFTISAALAGVAGILYANNLATLAATSKNFGYNMSILILVFVVLGGIGNIRGSIISAVILTLLPEMLRSLNDYRMLIYAVVLIVMMLLTSSPKAIMVRERIFSSFGKKGTKKEA